MTIAELRVLLLLVTFAAIFSSCKEASEEIPDQKVSGLDLENAPVTPVLVVKEPAESDSQEKEPEGEESAEPLEPVLRVFKEDEAIVIEGAIRSKIQYERIESQLGEAFSGVRIDNRMELDYDRIPVGWGNRVTEGFLIPYFLDITDPYVEYKEGIITLKGKATQTQNRAFHQLAGVIFAGAYSRDIDNQIGTIGENTKEKAGNKDDKGAEPGKSPDPGNFPEDLPLFLE